MDSLIKALKGEPTYKDFQLKDMKVQLRSLIRTEMDDVLRRVQATNIMSQEELIKLPILAYSLISINGRDVMTFEETQELFKKNDKMPVNYIKEEVFGKLDVWSLNTLYELYIELAREVREKQEQLKNSLAPQSAEPSGTSSKK